MATREGCKRVTATLTEEEFQHLEYWAGKKEVSINEFMKDAIEFYIRYQNKDIELPPLLEQRINQMRDMQYAQSQDIKSLMSVMISNFESLLGLVRGDNYLLEEQDGEI